MSNVKSGPWQEVRLGDVLQHRRERARGSEQLLSVTQDRGVVRQADAGRRDISSDDKSAYWRVYRGDIIYNTMRMWQGVVGRSEYGGIVSPAYTVCRPTSLTDARFLAHKLKHPAMIASFYRLSQGLVSDTWNLKYSSFCTISMLLPDLPEQRWIAKILASIDSQIEISRGLAMKAAELRAASIRESMRTGLDCFRDVEASELNSQIPRNTGSWTLAPLGSVLAGIDAGNSPDLEDTPAGPGQWGVLKVSAVGNGEFRPQENKVVRDRSLFNPAICVRKGDLLITRANTPQLVGRSCVVRDDRPGLMLCDKTLRLRVADQSVPVRYLHIVLGLAEIRRQIEIAATGTSSSMKNISQHAIKEIMIPIGNAGDVDRVVETDRLYEAEVASLNEEVDQLHLLKQGLMDDLLTGRVRVPGREMERLGMV